MKDRQELETFPILICICNNTHLFLQNFNGVAYDEQEIYSTIMKWTKIIKMVLAWRFFTGLVAWIICYLHSWNTENTNAQLRTLIRQFFIIFGQKGQTSKRLRPRTDAQFREWSFAMETLSAEIWLEISSYRGNLIM